MPGQGVVVDAGEDGLLAFKFLARARRLAQAVPGEIVYPLELAAHADRPAHRAHVQRQRVGHFVEQREAVTPFAIDLVDEGDDGDVAQPAHLEQLARLRLDALGGVDHHHGGIHRGQRAVGVLGKILVPRRIEQIEGDPVPLEGHDGAGHGNAALLLDLHPVGSRAPVRPAGLDFPGQMDRAALQQQFLGQRGLARVGVGDDGEGAAGRNGHEISFCLEMRHPRAGARRSGRELGRGVDPRLRGNEGKEQRHQRSTSVTSIRKARSAPGASRMIPCFSQTSPAKPTRSAIPAHGSTQR